MLVGKTDRSMSTLVQIRSEYGSRFEVLMDSRRRRGEGKERSGNGSRYPVGFFYHRPMSLFFLGGREFAVRTGNNGVGSELTPVEWMRGMEIRVGLGQEN
jgi:hypothetical protein